MIRKLLVTLVAICTLLPTAAEARYSTGGEVGLSESDQARLCGLPDDSHLLSQGQRLEAGHFDYEDWRAGELAQAAVTRLHDSLQRFESDLLGTAIDNVNRRLVVVYDPDNDVPPGLRAAVDRVGAPFTVDLVAGCRSLSKLRATEAALTSIAWAPEAAVDGFGVYLDPGSGTVTLEVAEGSTLGDAAVSAFGDEVRVVRSPAVENLSGGRTNDASPHYGDARITSHSCSANFSYTNNVFGFREQVTAGHCGSSGTYFSGANSLGPILTHNDVPDLNQYADLNQNYTNRIYVDPCCPSERNVIGKVNPGVGALVCVGGSYSLSQCGASITNNPANWCAGGFCQSGGIRGQLTGVVIAQGGDSGGIVYQRSGGTNAIAAGMINVGVRTGGDYFFGHTVAQIEATYALTLLTVP